MIGAFIIGLFVGCIIGIFMASMCNASKNNDLELEYKEREGAEHE